MKYLIDFSPNTFHFNQLVIFHDHKLLYKSIIALFVPRRNHRGILSFHWSNSDRFLHEPAQREESFDRGNISPSMRTKTARSYPRSPRHLLYFLPPSSSSSYLSHHRCNNSWPDDRSKKTEQTRFLKISTRDVFISRAPPPQK